MKITKLLYATLGCLFLFSCVDKDDDIVDVVLGDYTCTYKHFSWTIGDTNTTLYIETDTLVVTKVSHDEIKILDVTYQLDKDLSYNYSGTGSNKVLLNFFPDKDSISLDISTGGLGGGTKQYYNGTKK